MANTQRGGVIGRFWLSLRELFRFNLKNIPTQPGTIEPVEKNDEQQSMAYDLNPGPELALDPAVDALKRHIEGNPDLAQLFVTAFLEIPREFQDIPDGYGNLRIHDYHSMIIAIDRAIKMTPPWTSSSQTDLVTACPMNEALIWLMNTRTGSTIFLREDINAHLTSILKAWAVYLSSEESLSVINDKTQGWLSPEALKELLNEVNEAHNTPFQATCFEEIFHCQPSMPSYGFKSWDDFFTRRFQPSIRPVAFPSDDSVLINPCESQPLSIVSDAAAKCQFLLKGTSYSLLDMLDNDSHAQHFVGGTVYQGWLSVFNYHRWHAPTSGTILKVIQVRGTYFATDPSQGFENYDPLSKRLVPDRQAPDASQKLLSSIATRTVILLQADNREVGLVGFVAIGMSEVSSCVATVGTGQHVSKGQDIGSFHYGGSSYCLLFGPGVKLRFSPSVNTALTYRPDISGRSIAVNSELARIE